MSNLLRANPPPVPSESVSDAIAHISLTVYEAVVSIQKQQPEWMVETCRHADLQRYQAAFISRLQISLTKMHTRGSIAATLERFLQKLLKPSFFESTEYENLLHQIDAEFLSKLRDRSPELDSIAVLLLDAENIKLSPLEEGILHRISPYPIAVKIAFANWRSMGRHDLDFHDRSYQLIHVPNGKNAADLQMTAIGASLFLQYPHAKQVFVCSSDAHLITLCNLLQTQGWKVFALRKRGIQLSLTDWTNGKVKVFSVVENEFDPHDELEQKLAKLMLALTARDPGASIGISSLASQFKKHYGNAVTDVMRSWNLGSHFLKFLKTCSAFKLHETHSGWQVTLRPIRPDAIAPSASVDQVTPV